MPVSAGILAGGASSRMGADKALLEFRGRPLIEHQLDLLRPLFGELLIGANQPAPFARFGARVVPDVLPERCSLAGVHALIAAASAPYVFAVACDLPFLNPDLIRYLVDQRDAADVVMPFTERGPEPLHAVYGKACLPAIESAGRRGAWKMTSFLAEVRVARVDVREAAWAVEGRSPFTNANTPDEWRAAAP